MFVCAASIIYNVVFILISTGTPTEENHDIFSIFLFFTETDVSQDSKGKQGTILFSSFDHFHEHSDIYLQFCIMFNIHKHLWELGKQKYTMAVWYNVYKKLLSVLTEARKGVPGKHCLPNPCFFSFLIFPLKSNPSRNIVMRYSILI